MMLEITRFSIHMTSKSEMLLELTDMSMKFLKLTNFHKSGSMKENDLY